MLRDMFYTLFFTLITACMGLCGDYYVATTGDDTSGNGSVSNPWKTITHALSVIEGSINNPHTIHVAAGTYDSIHTGEKFPLKMKSYISLIGDGDSTTILDGLRKKRIILIEHVTAVVIQGFTIKRGKVPNINDAMRGGGICIAYSSFITIINNLITQNSSSGSLFESSGGGLDVFGSPFILITENKITGNVTGGDYAEGGGLCIGGSSCILSFNLIKSNIVYPHRAGGGGGISILRVSNVIIRNNTIEGNISDTRGAGIYCDGEALIIRNVISNDTAGYGDFAYGGGIYFSEFYSSGVLPVGGSIGNGNNIYNNVLLAKSVTGSQLMNYSGKPINARYNYFGDAVNPHDTSQIYGKFLLDPYMTSPVVFDNSDLVAIPSPVNFDTVTVGSSKTTDITFFNVTNSLYDSITINNITCPNSQIDLSTHSLLLSPLERDSIHVTFSPKSTGLFFDSLMVETNIGNFTYVLEGFIVDSTTSAAHEDNSIPAKLALEQNYPNPFNPSTTIRYQLPTADHVTLKVYNIFGQEIRTLVSDVQPAGNNSIEFEAENMASGVYFYKLTARSFTDIKKMVLLR